MGKPHAYTCMRVIFIEHMRMIYPASIRVFCHNALNYNCNIFAAADRDAIATMLFMARQVFDKIYENLHQISCVDVSQQDSICANTLQKSRGISRCNCCVALASGEINFVPGGNFVPVEPNPALPRFQTQNSRF